MARMIPPVPPDSTRSPGELQLFEQLRTDPDTEEWIVLHSFDLPDHPEQIAGEVDFVIIVPGAGVLCLEVKAHRTVRRDARGLWHLGAAPPTPRSPFKQAADAMYALREQLARRRPTLTEGTLFWSAVCFTATQFDTPAVEWHEWEVIDAGDLQRAPVSQHVRRVLSRAAEHVACSTSGTWPLRKRGPNHEQAEALTRALRPAFEFFQSPAARRRARDEELRRYTEDQYTALDAMTANERVVFEGAAGTGKTLLAIEAARRYAASGYRVLLVCFNRLLARYLQGEVAPLGEAVFCGTLHQFMLRTSGLPAPGSPGPEFWSSELPDAALEVLTKDGHSAWDALVVDEAQDLLRAQYLDVLDAALSGGLSGGRWRWFGDFERQALYDSGGADLAAVLAQRSQGVPRYLLTSNCRNPPRIATLVELLSGLEEGYAKTLRPDNGIEPELHFYASPAGQVSELERVLERLTIDGFTGSEITVLSRVANHAAHCYLRPPWSQRIKEPTAASGGDIRACTVHAYKGLEAPAVIVTDLTGITTAEEQALLYVAMTRATERLVVLLPETAKPDLAAAVMRPWGGKL